MLSLDLNSIAAILSTMTPLISANTDIGSLEEKIAINLESRIRKDTHYSLKEIERISNLNHKLFPLDFALNEEDTEQLRSLCQLSRCSLKTSTQITSHRKFIGQIIVFFKKLFWPFLRAQLKGTFDAQEEFNSLLIEAHAKQIAKINLNQAKN